MGISKSYIADLYYKWWLVMQNNIKLSGHTHLTQSLNVIESYRTELMFQILSKVEEKARKSAKYNDEEFTKYQIEFINRQVKNDVNRISYIAKTNPSLLVAIAATINGTYNKKGLEDVACVIALLDVVGQEYKDFIAEIKWMDFEINAYRGLNSNEQYNICSAVGNVINMHPAFKTRVDEVIKSLHGCMVRTFRMNIEVVS